MNKWKVAFWCCLILLVTVTIFASYSIIDQAYTLNYHKVNYVDTESDFENLIEIINKTDFTKTQVQKVLKDHNNYEFMEFQKDTISLNQIKLIF
ncbi:hypothetical protein [Zunongwangia endophytica]|uniref:Uncharacterized protein n=1 Tax=Zunongwangia endophytica TaxID=1808945 RepID=A0ABV8HB53_9FLAO|nr:hypothetical protein [Zunongwangia endophytica]MDN3593456.1 hypothetical protein [Zunongwangia endophytica]